MKELLVNMNGEAVAKARMVAVSLQIRPQVLRIAEPAAPELEVQVAGPVRVVVEARAEVVGMGKAVVEGAVAVAVVVAEINASFNRCARYNSDLDNAEPWGRKALSSSVPSRALNIRKRSGSAHTHHSS